MEQDEDNYPNFANAFPSTTSSDPATVAAHWNPALRQNADAVPDSDDDFFDRYPGATPKKSQPSVPDISEAPEEEPEYEEDELDPEALVRRRSISVQHDIDIRHEDATEHELTRVPSNQVEIEGPVVHAMDDADQSDEEDAILEPGDSAFQQEQALEERMPQVDSTQDLDSGVEEWDHATPHAEEGVTSPWENYEHQGEVTEMEEAQEPSDTVPLMDDEEDLPTPGLMSREPTFGAPEQDSGMTFERTPSPQQLPSKASTAMPSLDRSFTTNFAESPIEARQQPQIPSSIPEDWPSVGDDRTFGDLLDNRESSQLPTAEAPTTADILSQFPRPSEPEKGVLEEVAQQESLEVASPDDDLLSEDEGEIKEEDLAAAWGAAIDDDELLEETPTDFDPSNAFGGDDDGFLEDEPLAAVSQPQQQRSAPTPQQPYRPQSSQQQQQPQYSSQDPRRYSSGHGRAAGTPSTGLYDVYNTQPQQPIQRPSVQQAQSFADKAKGGYQSPYDLPMEVVKPRRRPQQQQFPNQGAPVVPPPRSSSISSSTAPTPNLTGMPPTLGRPPSSGMPPPAPVQRAAPRPGSASSMSPPQSSHSGGSAAAAPGSLKSTPKTSSGFFEDLPVTAKPRARPAGAYTPQLQQGGFTGLPTPPIGGPPHLQQQARPAAMPTPPMGLPVGAPQQQQLRPAAMQTPPMQQTFRGAQVPPIDRMASGGDLGLRRPEQLPLLPEQPQQPMQPPAQALPPNTRYSPGSQMNKPTPPLPSAVQNRYSPAPSATVQVPAATSRYSPAPAAQPQQGKPRQPSLPTNVASSMQQSHPFAPRTSSPLAGFHTDKPHPALPPEASRGAPPSSPSRVNGLQQQQRISSMPVESRSPSKYTPGAVQQISEPPTMFAPPQRPRTQSPDTTMKRPSAALQQPMVRPSSSAGTSLLMQQQQILPKRPALPHRRQFSRDLTFAVPQDERSQDPLERWKGHAIFKWSASGTIVSTFPKQTPFYAAGQGIPSVKCTPGAITVQDASVFMPMDERNAKFPGPLTAKSKRQKKDVVSWLEGKIEDLERQAEGAMLNPSLDVVVRKRAEEKVILWKLVRIFVDHDGVLEGNQKIEEEVRKVLLPNLAQMAQVADLQSPVSTAVMPDPVDKQVLFQIRQALLEGQRERAVWLAEEKKLWGHAMLIASTVGSDAWKQIVQAFVRSQVKSVGSDARSTAALYQVFAGNSEECVDELVPPSARAGFQMINKADGTVSGNPLEGLDQWRETLGLITSNRTPSDGQSLLALGKLLAGYGRVEAAHTCFLFARQIVKHTGADDAEAHFVLLGANHQTLDEAFGQDLDSITLTEVYEYAASLSAPSTGVSYIPHLQAFKLVHAQELAAYGLKTKAQTYCDAITSAYTSTTRPSPYYHPAFTQAIADFSALLSQTPQDAKSGFFSKPSMKGAAGWFSKFVAGDEDQESTGSGPGGAGGEDMAGPFGRVNGETPSLSRSASGTDLYNPMMGGMPIPGMTPAAPQSFAPSSAPGRYAPGGQHGTSRYTPGQSYTGHGFPAADPQRPGSSRYAPAPSSNLGVPSSGLSRRASDQSLPYAPLSRRGSAQDTSSQGSYEPRPVLSDEGSAYSYSPAFNSPMVQAQHLPAVQEPDDVLETTNGIPEPPHEDEEGPDAETGGGYLPPTGGYEPPSYEFKPYEPEPDSPEEPKPKRKTYGDEDDYDTGKSAAALKKAEADRAADEAFKKAAEADAARDKDKSGQKKGWLGGWFGGKKDANLTPGPIKAKLGEENSFYYDESLKKWVNKKAGPEAATPVAATPPPPRSGPVSRVASSGLMGPPSGPPSRASSGLGATAAGARPPTSGSAAASGPPSGPPSRAGTPASNPSSEPGSQVPLGVNGEVPSASALAPPLRPGSSLSTASSIDDLLAGPPGSRKGGTVKGKKKGRYVDVMAQ